MQDKLIKWIVINQHPFTVIEELNFIDFVKSLCPNATLFSADTVKRKIMDFYISDMEKMQNFLKEVPGKFSFTIDTWTSPTMKSFLAITAHFIDENWKIQNIIVDFVQIFGSHTGENIKDAFVAGLENLSLQNKVSFIFIFLF